MTDETEPTAVPLPAEAGASTDPEGQEVQEVQADQAGETGPAGQTGQTGQTGLTNQGGHAEAADPTRTDPPPEQARNLAPPVAPPSEPPPGWSAPLPPPPHPTPVWPLPPISEATDPGGPGSSPAAAAAAAAASAGPAGSGGLGEGNPTGPLDPTDPGLTADPVTAESPTPLLPLPPAPRPATSGSGGPGGPGGSKGSGNRRSWVGIAVVAALIGAGVGAGVTALTDGGNNDDTVTVHEGNADPGAAALSGNVTIPELVKKVIPAVVSIDVKSHGNEDEGTGMIITSSGEVITNNHVIELFTQGGGTGTITVTEYGQKSVDPATLVGYNTQQDVALLKINNPEPNLPTVTFGSSSKAVVGDAVVAIGNALGLAAGTPTVTQGIVSALGRSVSAGGEGTATENLQNLIQTDAAINPGNSGGPLIDTAGQVIGMNTAVAGSSDDGTNAQNIGFAIPADAVESLLPQLEKGGPAINDGGYLGVINTTLTPALRQQYGFTPTSGVVVLNVISGSPAAKAGLVQGDVIVSVDGTAVNTAAALTNKIQNSKAGQKVQITYYVGNSKRTTTVTLGSQTEAQQQQSQVQSNETNPFGAGGFTNPGSSGGSGSSGSDS
jgi:S1-C subfamily serine protease